MEQDLGNPICQGGGAPTVVIAGEAFGAGTNTFAEGDIDLEIDHRGPLTIARGTATFSAVAEGPAGDLVYASAETSVTASGYDLLFAIARDGSWQAEADGWVTESAVSQTQFLAIDLAGFQFVGTPGFGYLMHGPSPVHAGGGPAGNLSALTLDLNSYGTDTLLEATASVMAVDDQLSLVSAFVFGA